jgi:molecular chaperone GrpE (heat shock protein)
MRETNNPMLAKWPFYLGDALLVGTGWWICYQTRLPLGNWQLVIGAACVAGGALFSITPFILEYRALIRIMEAGALTTVVAQIQKLEQIGASIVGATAHWQEVHEQAQKAVAAAKEIQERMTVELRSFAEFMARSNNNEKATLRLETEKLRRAENDWLEVSVRMLDHVYALHVGAVRSGQATLISQVGHFQNACRDAARRIGLTPFTASEAEKFNPQRRQLLEGEPGTPPEEALIGETVATGYTFQGQLLRPAVVRLRSPQPAAVTNGNGGNGETPKPEHRAQLPLPTASPKSNGG